MSTSLDDLNLQARFILRGSKKKASTFMINPPPKKTVRKQKGKNAPVAAS